MGDYGSWAWWRRRHVEAGESTVAVRCRFCVGYESACRECTVMLLEWAQNFRPYTGVHRMTTLSDANAVATRRRDTAVVRDYVL